VTRIEAGIEDLVQRIGDGTGRVLAGQTIERSDHAVYGLHRAQGDDEHEFLGLASKPLDRVSGLGLKTDSCGLVIWPTKSPRRFLDLYFKTEWAMVC
jgi:hypothetical protein